MLGAEAPILDVNSNGTRIFCGGGVIRYSLGASLGSRRKRRVNWAASANVGGFKSADGSYSIVQLSKPGNERRPIYPRPIDIIESRESKSTATAARG